MFEFTQIGWFDPGSKRFCYTDEKDHFAPRNDDYTHPVFAVDPETASRLTVQLESEKKPTPKEALKETGVPRALRCPPKFDNTRITKLLGQYRGSLIGTGFADIASDTIDEIDAVVVQLRNA